MTPSSASQRNEQSVQVEIVVLSVASAIDRRTLVASNLRNCPHGWSFFDALTENDDHGLAYDEDAALFYRGLRLSPGEISCYASHAAILRRFVSNGASDWLLVLEDDVYYDVNFLLAELCATLSAAKIAYIRLFARRPAPFCKVARWGGYHLIRFQVGPFGTQAYLISRAGAERFLRSVTRMVRPVDDEFDRFWDNGLPIYAVFPFPAIELHRPSTIERLPQRRGVPSLLERARRSKIEVIDQCGRAISNLVLKMTDKKLKRIVRTL